MYLHARSLYGIARIGLPGAAVTWGIALPALDMGAAAERSAVLRTFGDHPPRFWRIVITQYWDNLALYGARARLPRRA